MGSTRRKIDDGKTIIVSNKENSLSLKLNDEKTKVNLKIDDGRVDEFTVKKENGKLNLYLLGTGSKADSAFESLFEELQNDDPDIRAEASRLLSKNHKTIEKLVSVYQNCIDSEPRKGVLAGRVLGRNISISAGSQEIIHDETSNIWYGIAVAFTPCVCAHCGSLNLGIPVPEGGLYIESYYQRENEEGVYALPVFCDYCSKEFFITWDDDPRYLLISYCESCDETYDVDVTECPHCGNKLKHMSKYDIKDLRKKSRRIKNLDYVVGGDLVQKGIYMEQIGTEVVGYFDSLKVIFRLFDESGQRLYVGGVVATHFAYPPNCSSEEEKFEFQIKCIKLAMDLGALPREISDVQPLGDMRKLESNLERVGEGEVNQFIFDSTVLPFFQRYSGEKIHIIPEVSEEVRLNALFNFLCSEVVTVSENIDIWELRRRAVERVNQLRKSGKIDEIRSELGLS